MNRESDVGCMEHRLGDSNPGLLLESWAGPICSAHGSEAEVDYFPLVCSCTLSPS